MISVDEARNTICEALKSLPSENISLEEAFGRVLAQPVFAQMSQPPFRSSAMDGYAVRLSDVAEPNAQLRIIGVSSAGERFEGNLQPGAAVRIFTGAPVPDGADHVVIQEHTERSDGTVTIIKKQDGAKHIRPRGVDFIQGDELIAKNVRLDGPQLANYC